MIEDLVLSNWARENDFGADDFVVVVESGLGLTDLTLLDLDLTVEGLALEGGSDLVVLLGVNEEGIELLARDTGSNGGLAVL